MKELLLAKPSWMREVRKLQFLGLHANQSVQIRFDYRAAGGIGGNPAT